MVLPPFVMIFIVWLSSDTGWIRFLTRIFSSYPKMLSFNYFKLLMIKNLAKIDKHTNWPWHMYFWNRFLSLIIHYKTIPNLHPLNTFSTFWWDIQKEHFVNYAINPLLHAQETVMLQYQLAIFLQLKETPIVTSFFLEFGFVKVT